MGPLDYSIDVQTPFQAALQGYSAGSAIRNDQQQQEAQRQAQAQAQQRQEQMLAAQKMVWTNPTAENFSKLILIDPKNSEAYQKSWDTLDKTKQQAHASDLLQWGSAIKSGNSEIAADQINQRADAMENSAGGPTPQSKALRTQAKLVKDNPEFALGQFQAMLSVNPLGKEAGETLSRLAAADRAEQMAPAEKAKAEAEARIKQAEAEVKGVDAKAASEDKTLSQQEKREKIETARDDRRIKELDTQIAQANSETQRGQLVLERDKIIAAKAEKAESKASDAQATLNSTEETISAFSRILKHPGLSSGTGTGGDFRAFFKSSDAADFRADVETLKSKAFLTQVGQMKGQGGLSNAEGERLTAAVANLDPSKQSTPSFINNVNIAKKLFEKGRAKLLAEGKLPTSGGGYVDTIPGVGNVTEGNINELMMAWPGSTRQQVMDYLSKRKAGAAKPNTGGATGGF